MSGRRDRVKELEVQDVVVRGVTGEINGRVVGKMMMRRRRFCWWP
jgi:hypothetical protein